MVAEDGVAVVDRSVIARLGQGVGQTGLLRPEAIARALDAIRRHAAEARSLGAIPFAIGTSALRDATNRDELLGPAAEALGRPVRLLTGDEEATYTYRGALLGLAGTAGARTVVDVGGGSTEIVVGEGEHIRAKVSLQIGAVRLAERFLHGDPPTRDEVDALRACVRTELQANVAPVAPLVFVAGTATTLAAADLALEAYDPARVHGHRLPRARLDALVDRFLACTTEARSRIPGVEPARAEVLPAGALIFSEIAALASASAVTISDRGLRWGVLGALDRVPSLL